MNQISTDYHIHPPLGAVNEPAIEQNGASVVTNQTPDNDIHPPLRAINDQAIDQNDASLVSETVTE